MGEGLQLQVPGGFGPDLGDLRKAQLPGQDHPVRPQIVPGPGGLVVGHAGLGAHVDLHGGGIALGQGQHPHIRQDHRGDPALLQQFQPGGEGGHLLVAGHGVAGDVEIRPLLPAQGGGPGQVLLGEVPREGPHPEGVPCQVHRIRPVGQGHFQPLPVPRRGQQFQSLLHGHQLFRKAWKALLVLKKWWTPSSPRA